MKIFDDKIIKPIKPKNIEYLYPSIVDDFQ